MPLNRIQLTELQAGARVLGIQLLLIDVRAPKTLQSAFQQAEQQTQAAIVLPEPITYTNRREVTALAAQYHLPTIYLMLDYVTDGGLMAYGADLRAMYRRAAEYVDKILGGAKAGDLPIEQSNQRLEVNLKTAKALGVRVPDTILLRASGVVR